MQDKIIVTPSEVRGLGNIVSEKELEDFLAYMSTITSSSEEVGGISRTVYTVEATPPVITLTLTMGKTVLDYDERTTLTATLLDENNTGIAGEEIKFYNENGYLFKTATTDSNGIITINNVYSHQPGQHTYTGILSSDTTITGSVTVTINKITSTLSLATSSGSVNVGGTFTLSGTLNAGSGQSVKIYENGTLIDTVTTGSGGAYSKSITASSAGSFAYTAVFDGTSVYTNVTSSVVSVNVIAPSYDDIVVSADNQILSYADSEKATLYAQLQDNGSDAAVSGVTITFKQGNTTLGTAQTDDGGKATLVDGYTSAGVGDVTITATDGVLVSKTYEIKDYVLSRQSEVSISKSVSTDTYFLFDDNLIIDDLPTDFEMAWSMKTSTDGILFAIGSSATPLNQYLLSIGYSGIYYRSYSKDTATTNHDKTGFSANNYHSLKIVKQGTTISYYVDNSLLGSDTVNWFDDISSYTIKYDVWKSMTINIKELTIKPL